MKNINFIKPVPPHRDKEIRLWIWVTLITSSAAIITIITITGTQWHMYSALHKEKNELQQQLLPFPSAMEQQHKQVQEKELRHQQLDKLSKYRESPKNPSDTLSSLRKALGAIPIQSVTLSKGSFELHALCTNAQQANACLQKLTSEKMIHNIKLTSLQANQKQLIAIFKGEITTK